MSAFILALLGLGVAFAFIGSDSDNDVFTDDPPTEDDPQPPVNPMPGAPEPGDPNPEAPVPDPDGPNPVDPTPEPPTVPSIEDMIFDVGDDEIVTGGDGDDVFFSSSTDGVVGATANGGAGNDAFKFDNFRAGGGALTIDGGEGDDFIAVNGGFNTVAGGAGNDTIQGLIFSSGLSGGAGDDYFRVESLDMADFLIIEGGDGNDTIDASSPGKLGVFGDAGDDLIISQAYGSMDNEPGSFIDGGDGNDTLSHNVGVAISPNTFIPSEEGPDLTGGEGSDRFEISIIRAGIPNLNSISQEEADFLENPAGTITDFERGVDEIVVDLSGTFFDFVVESGTMVEDSENGRTTVTIRLLSTSDSFPTQDVILTINETGLTWDDIAFEGTPPPTLTMG